MFYSNGTQSVIIIVELSFTYFSFKNRNLLTTATFEIRVFQNVNVLFRIIHLNLNSLSTNTHTHLYDTTDIRLGLRRVT